MIRREGFFDFVWSYRIPSKVFPKTKIKKDSIKKQIQHHFFVKNDIFYDKKYKKDIDELGNL